MKKHRAIALILILVYLAIPFIASAIGMPTVPYGGRVLTTKIPTVTCTPFIGTAPVVLSSNVAGLGGAIGSAFSSNQSVGQRLSGIAGGLYDALPLYTTSNFKKPKIGGYILGRMNVIPDFTTCNSTLFGGFPVPVKKTSTYGVSPGGSSLPF